MTSKTRYSLIAAIVTCTVAGFFWSRFNDSADRIEADLDKPALSGEQEIAVAPVIVDQTEKPNDPVGTATTEPVQVGADETVSLSPKVKLVAEIINSKNDNDPRLDSELKLLDEGTKTELRDFYKSRKAEDRNGRGTVVFLLGRNLASTADVNFLEDVFAENPCLSLSDCSKDNNLLGGHDEGHDGSQEITLSYPKLVALNALEKLLAAKNLSHELKEAAWRALKVAEKSPEPRVSSKALAIRSKLEN